MGLNIYIYKHFFCIYFSTSICLVSLSFTFHTTSPNLTAPIYMLYEEISLFCLNNECFGDAHNGKIKRLLFAKTLQTWMF